MKTSINRAARYARESTRWRELCSRCSNNFFVLASSTAPANATSLSGGSVGRSSIMPSRKPGRSEEHTSELQSLAYLVCRLLLEKKKNVRHLKHSACNYPHRSVSTAAR